MNTFQLDGAEHHFKGKQPYDLDYLLKQGNPFNHPDRIWLFIRYMIYLEKSTPEKILALYRMKIIVEQNPKYDASNEILAFIAKETEYLEFELKMEKETNPIVFTTPINAQEFNKIKFKGNLKQLTTLFYELHNQGKFDTSKENLCDWIVACFTDKNNKIINRDTVDMYLREDQVLNRVLLNFFHLPICRHVLHRIGENGQGANTPNRWKAVHRNDRGLYSQDVSKC
jgi:hypothetical protein